MDLSEHQHEEFETDFSGKGISWGNKLGCRWLHVMCWGNGCWKLCTVRGADRRTGDSGLSKQFEVRIIKM